jgi:hypothetical protein
MQTQQKVWKQVGMREYRILGERIAVLEALARGETIVAPDRPPTPGAEPLTIGEQQATVRGQLIMVLRGLRASLQAVLDTRPQLGEDCVLIEVRRVSALTGEVEGATDERAASLN